MIEEILNLHFTDIKEIVEPIFSQMTENQKIEMRNIFNESEDIESKLDKAVSEAADNSYNEGYEKGYEDGYEEGVNNE